MKDLNITSFDEKTFSNLIKENLSNILTKETFKNIITSELFVEIVSSIIISIGTNGVITIPPKTELIVIILQTLRKFGIKDNDIKSDIKSNELNENNQFSNMNLFNDIKLVKNKQIKK